MSNSIELINAFAPTVPMWAVFYNVETEELETFPIIACGLIRENDGNVILEPLSFSKDYMDQAFDRSSQYSNFVGYSLTANPNKELFTEEINRVRKANKVSAKGSGPLRIPQEPMLRELPGFTMEITDGMAVLKIALGGRKSLIVDVEGSRVAVRWK